MAIDRLPQRVPPPQPCRTGHRMTGNEPCPVLFDEPRCPVLIRRISCSFSSSDEVLFSFPLRYLFAIGYLLSYLALDGQHHLYSASTFKLTYSRRKASLTRPTRSRVTPCAPGSQPVCCKPRHRDSTPSTTGPEARRGQPDSVSGFSLFARSYWGNLY